jgi:hypothetical protein
MVWPTQSVRCSRTSYLANPSIKSASEKIPVDETGIWYDVMIIMCTDEG